MAAVLPVRRSDDVVVHRVTLNLIGRETSKTLVSTFIILLVRTFVILLTHFENVAVHCLESCI